MKRFLFALGVFLCSLPALGQPVGNLQPGQALGVPINASAPAPAGATSYRTLLTGPQTLYYRTDGNNSCNGLTNVAGSSGNCAFADPNGCMSYVSGNYDLGGGNTLTCQAGETTPKTFSSPTAGYQCPTAGFTGSGSVVISGNLNQATVTTPVASPGVVNWTGHGLTAGSPVYFSVTGGSLPTGLNITQLFYVISTGLGANSFEVATSPGGSAVNFTGSSTGTQTGNAATTLIDGTTNSGNGFSLNSNTCVITLQNMQIKAAGNSIQCISRAGSSGLLWQNIIWQGSGGEDIFAGTGCNFTQKGTDWIAAQGGSNPHIETDGSAEVRNTGQITNISANLTYGTTTASFVYSAFHGRITYTGSPTINLNGFSVTGQRCYADNDGIVEQAALGGTFFPGNSACGAATGGIVVQ